jgi:organic radical activating enzyme
MVANMPELIAALKESGYWIGVETNGLESPPWLQFVDYVAVSPKAAFAERYESDEALTSADEVRIVAESDDVVEFCKRMRERIAATDYYVSPCDHNGEIDFATAKSVLAQLEGWSLSVQLHKILGFR